ncbi:MAG: hypothetical protein K2K25_03785 [Muribaculaceae bacterium]|nr:hypothetical protein [Muribaculaceae bacterium]
MKKLAYGFFSIVVVMLLVVGCSKDTNDDASSLLRTVPADASSVVMLNVAHVVDRLGGSTDGSKIKISKDLQKTIDESQALKPEDKQRLNDICNGETGIAVGSVVFFSAARSYVTGLLNDPEKFVAYLQKETGSQVREEDGGKVIDKVAIIGNQFWYCTTGTPDMEQLKYYQQLNEKQSYASADAAPLLLDGDKAVTYVADVSRSLAFVPNAGYMKMVSSLIFNDMAYVAGSADIQKNSIVGDASVLNSDMKPAQLLIPVEKIDASLIKKFENGGDIYFAAGISKKLVKKISDLASTMMGSNAQIAASVLEAIDGTVAVRADAGASSCEALVQTSGKNFNELSSVLQSLFGLVVTRDGDIMTAVYGNKDFSGSITPGDAADKLKGAWVGMVSDGFFARDVTTVTKLTVEKKSLRLDFEAEGGVDALINAITK